MSCTINYSCYIHYHLLNFFTTSRTFHFSFLSSFASITIVIVRNYSEIEDEMRKIPKNINTNNKLFVFLSFWQRMGEWNSHSNYLTTIINRIILLLHNPWNINCHIVAMVQNQHKFVVNSVEPTFVPQQGVVSLSTTIHLIIRLLNTPTLDE